MGQPQPGDSTKRSQNKWNDEELHKALREMFREDEGVRETVLATWRSGSPELGSTRYPTEEEILGILLASSHIEYED